MNSNKALRNRYQRLAYCVVRDAIGFYLGIPHFFEDNTNHEEILTYLSSLYPDKDEEYLEAKIKSRILELQEDYEYSRLLLSENNLWFEILDITPDIIQEYLNKLTTVERRKLAIIPRWATQDYSLGRPHINNNFDFLDERTDGFN